MSAEMLPTGWAGTPCGGCKSPPLENASGTAESPKPAAPDTPGKPGAVFSALSFPRKRESSVFGVPSLKTLDPGFRRDDNKTINTGKPGAAGTESSRFGAVLQSQRKGAGASSAVKRFFEGFIEKFILANGIACILLVILIFLFLAKEGFALFKTVSPLSFLAGTHWYPISEPPRFGIIPILLGSVVVTLGATFISVPLGIACALFIGEIAPAWLREILKAGVELLAAVPSIVIGFIGMITLAPMVKQMFHLPTGLTALSGSITLAFMAIPTIVSIMEDAITAVPKTYREGSLALGATHWQTIYRVVIPAASSGITAAVMLGIGRVIGETMAVMMITGNAAVIPASILEPVRTMTATIAAEMGETVQGSEHYFALFALGLVLFLITFVINMMADIVLHRERK